MTILHLGVVDIPYTGQVNIGASTTGDVADILEAKYHVMEIFFEEHQQEIADLLAAAMAGSLENLLLGAAMSTNVLADAQDKIKVLFDQFITSKAMDGLGIPGVPTAASLKGTDHRKADKKGTPGRPSFVDTGEYVNSFLVWVD